MKTKFRRCSPAIVAFATLMLGEHSSRAAVGGPVCNVPTDYPMIQLAVNDPGCLTINVAPGLYPENVTIPRTLTLNGAQAGTPAPGRVAAESIVAGPNPIGANPVIRINAANVVVDGFTIRNPVTTGAATGIAVNTAGSGAWIVNNIIDGVTSADPGPNGTAQAIYLQNGPDNVQIVANEMKNVQSVRSAKGVLVGDNGALNAALNTLIQGNSILNITSRDRGAYGVSVANSINAVSGLQIRDNTITDLTNDLTGWIHAIGLEGNTPGAIVEGNAISNFVTASPDAVAVWFESNPGFSTAQVNLNNFNLTILSYGIAVHPSIPGTGAVDGTCNWWGDPNGPGPVGPGAGAKVSPRVVYTPWLTAPTPIGACIGGGSTPGKVTGGGHIPGEDPLFSPLGDLLSIPALTLSASGSGRATFGFVAKCCPETGNLEYKDQDADVRIKAQTIDNLSISPSTACPAMPGAQHATFTGTADVIRSTGTLEDQPFTVDVDDCGEPGTADTFGIRTTGYANGPSTLTGGNIQIR